MKRIKRKFTLIMILSLICGFCSCGNKSGEQSGEPVNSGTSEPGAVMGTFNEVPADALAGGWIRNGAKGTMTLKSDGSVELKSLPELNYTGWRQILANVIELKAADGSLDSALVETYQHPMTMKIKRLDMSFTHDQP